MITAFSCPVCGADDWRTIQQVELHRGDPFPDDRDGKYKKLRHRIFFELWLPDATSARLECQCCASCGFVVYKPRPTEQELDAKYRFLEQEAPRRVGGFTVTSIGQERNRRRAQRIYNLVRRYCRAPTLRVLDFGGEDGKLLAPFVEAGAECDLIDYSRQTIAGVRKIGDTLSDASPERKYDAVVCSHVLEHLANPGQTVSALSDLLVVGGVIYGEVPLEMWRGLASLRWDPVTHVNFFNLDSFARLFESRSLEILEARETGGSYGDYRNEVVIAIARVSPGGVRPVPRNGLQRTMRRLRPGLLGLLLRSWRLRTWPQVADIKACARQMVPSRVRRSLKRVLHRGTPSQT